MNPILKALLKYYYAGLFNKLYEVLFVLVQLSLIEAAVIR